MGIASTDVKAGSHALALFDVKNKPATAAQGMRKARDKRVQVAKVHQHVGANHKVGHARGAPKVLQNLAMHQFVIDAFFSCQRQHARREIDADQTAGEGTKQRPAPSAAAAQVQHVQQAFLAHAIGTQQVAQDLRHAIAKAAHVGIVSARITVKHIQDDIVRQARRHRGMADGHQPHHCDGIGGRNREAALIPGRRLVDASGCTQKSAGCAVDLQVVGCFEQRQLQRGNRQVKIALLQGLHRLLAMVLGNSHGMELTRRRRCASARSCLLNSKKFLVIFTP